MGKGTSLLGRVTPGTIGQVITGLVLAFTGASLLLFVREHAYYLRRGPGPAFLPRWVGGLMLVASAIYIVQVLRQEGALGDEKMPDRPALLRIGTIIVTLLLAAPTFPALGFRLTSTILLFIFFNLQGIKSVRQVVFHLALALGFSMVLHLVFFTWLHVQLPRGIW